MGQLTGLSNGRTAARKKFLRFFPKGFADAKYMHWERDYKWEAHLHWQTSLNQAAYRQLLSQGKYQEIAGHAVKMETRTNLLFSFEKMALRDAVKTEAGARAFAEGLYQYVYGPAAPQERFEQFAGVVAALPRRQTRVLTWPLLTVFGFLARPDTHIFLKPRVTQTAASAYGFPFAYTSEPNWQTYQSLLDFAGQIRQDMADHQPRDFIDLQSFIWVCGSAEYDG